MSFVSIAKATEHFQKGGMLILVDDEDRENEGDLCVAAQFVTPSMINFITREARGLVCLAMTAERLKELNIPMMVQENTSAFGTAFCVSIDARHGTTTGISAYDRALTVQAVVNPETKSEDLARPGHIFPLRAAEGGVLRRPGQTEASVDLARLAGLFPAAVICEIMREDGTMARLKDLQKISDKHNIPVVMIKDLIEHRMKTERFVRRVSETRLPTVYGEFKLFAYENELDKNLHLALVYGDIKNKESVLVRVHSECLTGEAFHSLRCDCRDQLDMAFEKIINEGAGALVYLRQEGRGIGLKHKLQAYALQDEGKDTVEANKELGFKPDPRDYGVGAQILSEIGLSKIRVLTNNLGKLAGLSGFGIEITERIPLETEPTEKNIHYLKTKKQKLGHILSNV